MSEVWIAVRRIQRTAEHTTDRQVEERPMAERVEYLGTVLAMGPTGWRTFSPGIIFSSGKSGRITVSISQGCHGNKRT